MKYLGIVLILALASCAPAPGTALVAPRGLDSQLEQPCAALAPLPSSVRSTAVDSILAREREALRTCADRQAALANFYNATRTVLTP
jgi:hypothetical protein